jgi:hypothetical protein
MQNDCLGKQAVDLQICWCRVVWKRWGWHSLEQTRRLPLMMLMLKLMFMPETQSNQFSIIIWHRSNILLPLFQ